MTPEQRDAVDRVLGSLRGLRAADEPLICDFTEKQLEAIAIVWSDLKEKLSSLSREEVEAESASRNYYMVAGPCYSRSNDACSIALDRVRDGYQKLVEEAAEESSPERRKSAADMLVAYQAEIDRLERLVQRPAEQVDMIEHVVAFAKFDAGAFDAAIALFESKKGQQHPRLAEFIYQVRKGVIVRPDAGQNVRLLTDLRNRHLAFAVWELKQCGISPTKAAESQKADGSDIVAEIYDDLLENDADGVIVKAKGGNFGRHRMRDIWLKEVDIKNYRILIDALPEGD